MYAANEDVARMITRLASHGEITAVKVKAVARAQHRAMPVAGVPTPWGDLTYVARQRKYAEARAALEGARP